MKKLVLSVLLLLSLLTGFIFHVHSKANAADYDINEPQRLNTVIMTLLMPEVQKAVEDYYEPYLSWRPITTAYCNTSKITNLVGNKQDSEYSVTMEVSPYIGPHINIGIDRITLNITADGYVKVKEYEHVESYDLPPHLQNSIIQPFPNFN